MQRKYMIVTFITGIFMVNILSMWAENKPADAQASWAEALTKAVSQVKEKKWDGGEMEARKQGMDLAAQFGPSAIDWFKVKVSDNTEIIAQQIALWALGFIGNRESVTELIAIIKGKQENRNIAILAIANADPENARWGLEQILLNKELHLQNMACFLLRVVGDEKTLGILDNLKQEKMNIDLLDNIEKTWGAILYRTQEIKDRNEKEIYVKFERVFWESECTAPNFRSAQMGDIYVARQIFAQWTDKIPYKFLSRKLDKSVSLSREVIIAAYLCGLLKDVSMLETLLKLSTEQKLSAARWAVAQIGGQKAADTLEEILVNEEPTVFMQENIITCGMEKNAARLEAKASKEADPERAKAFKDVADGIRKRLKDEQEQKPDKTDGK